MEHLEELISILEKETLLYQNFLQVLRDERESIASFSVDHLNVIVSKKLELVAAIREAEGMRGAIVGSLGDSLDVKNLEFTISYLIETLKEPHATRLRRCAQRLSLLVGEVSEFNKDNGVLIERSLRYINDSIQILSGLADERPTYSLPSNYNPAHSGFGRVFSAEA